MYGNSEVSLTDSFRKYSEEHPSEETSHIAHRKLYDWVHNNLSEFLDRTVKLARIYHTVCTVYRDIFPILEEGPHDTVCEFLEKETARIMDTLYDEKKIYGSLTENLHKDCLRKELAGYAEGDFIKKAIPVSLSHIADGSYLKRYASELESLKEGHPTAETQELIEYWDTEKENAEATLEALERGWDLLPEDEWEMAERDLTFGISVDGEYPDMEIEEFIQERAVRVYLMAETLRRLCNGDTLHDASLFYETMDFLGLHMGG